MHNCITILMYISSVYICIAPVAICGILTCRQWPERGVTIFTQVDVPSSRTSSKTNVNGKSVQTAACLRQGRLLVKAVSTMEVLIHYFAVQANSTTAVGLVEVSICQPPN